MSYLSFDKQQLVNLEFSLNREIIRANRVDYMRALPLYIAIRESIMVC